jgi:hypothetical protein
MEGLAFSFTIVVTFLMLKSIVSDEDGNVRGVGSWLIIIIGVVIALVTLVNYIGSPEEKRDTELHDLYYH